MPAGSQISSSSTGAPSCARVRRTRMAPSVPFSSSARAIGAGARMADRVLTGTAACEFNQTVKIERLEGHAGNFRLTFDRKAYIVHPKETTTGAILLRDRSEEIIWVQIPKKSMLMNQKEHHRMVDNCQHEAQRVAAQGDTPVNAH